MTLTKLKKENYASFSFTTFWIFTRMEVEPNENNTMNKLALAILSNFHNDDMKMKREFGWARCK